MTEDTTTEPSKGLSRRSFIAKGAIAGGAVVWATPIVDSILSPASGATQGSVQGCACAAILGPVSESSCQNQGNTSQLVMQIGAQGFTCLGSSCRTSGTQLVWTVNTGTAVNVEADQGEPAYTFPTYTTGDATHLANTLYGVSLTGGGGSTSTFVVKVSGETFCNNGAVSCTPNTGPVCFSVSVPSDCSGVATFTQVPCPV